MVIGRDCNIYSCAVIRNTNTTDAGKETPCLCKQTISLATVSRDVIDAKCWLDPIQNINWRTGNTSTAASAYEMCARNVDYLAFIVYWSELVHGSNHLRLATLSLYASGGRGIYKTRGREPFQLGPLRLTIS